MFNYYCSNYGKNLSADKEGWWIAYDTESTDHGAIWVEPERLKDTDGEIKDAKQALDILKDIMDYEWDAGHFYASVNHFGYQSQEDL